MLGNCKCYLLKNTDNILFWNEGLLFKSASSGNIQTAVSSFFSSMDKLEKKVKCVMLSLYPSFNVSIIYNMHDFSFDDKDKEKFCLW